MDIITDVGIKSRLRANISLAPCLTKNAPDLVFLYEGLASTRLFEIPATRYLIVCVIIIILYLTIPSHDHRSLSIISALDSIGVVDIGEVLPSGSRLKEHVERLSHYIDNFLGTGLCCYGRLRPIALILLL